jgi:ribosome-binding factor A
MSRRTEKISQLLKGEVARALREEATDPRLELVTVTRIDVAPDLSNALVYWSVMGDTSEDRLRDVARGLDSAAGFLRGRIARTLQLKKTPELRFRHDPSLALASETLSLIRDLSSESAALVEPGADEPTADDPDA